MLRHDKTRSRFPENGLSGWATSKAQAIAKPLIFVA
jgi:hypothetical protein